MKGYKGKVYFYRELISGYYGCIMANADEDFPLGDNYIVVAAKEVDVTFDTDTREAEVEALEKEKVIKAGEYQHYLDIINGRIESLRAINHDGSA